MEERTYKIWKVDAFAKKPLEGNPAGVVLDASNFTDKQMLMIAKEFNVSETAFVSKSRVADFKVRFFLSRW